MLKNYLTIAWRHVLRHKGYAFINVVGLAVGLACCLLLLLFVRHELSYDRFHADADRLYRLVQERRSEGAVQRSAWNTVPTGPTLQDQFPEAEQVVRFWRSFRPNLQSGTQILREDGLYFTDPAALEVFSFPLLQGAPRTALDAPGSVVLTEAAARKYFGEKDPLGQTLDYHGYPGSDSLTLTVTGVLRDLPSNTHFEFNALASLNGIEDEHDNFGSHKPIWTYVRLREGASAAALTQKLPAFVDQYLRPELHDAVVLRLEPLQDIHLRSAYEGGFKPGSDITYVYLFSAIGFFILVIACINFVNLATARSLGRAKEVGLRKVLGAGRRQLVRQFLGESVLLSLLAALLALVFVDLLLPAFNTVFAQALTLRYTGAVPLALLAAAVLVGVLAGLYPALFLSRFQPAATLRGRFASSPSGAVLRKSLVVFQFTISVVLLIGTVLVQHQMDYLRTKDLGLDETQVVVLPYSPEEEALRNSLRQHPSVQDVTVAQRVPVSTLNLDTRPVRPEGFTENISAHNYIIDPHFLDVFGIELAAGRGFSAERPADAAAFLVNEAAVRQFGWGTPDAALGKQLTWPNGDKTGPVVGVVKDFHLASLHEEIPPLVLHMLPEQQWWRTFLAVKIRPDDVPATLAFLEQTWKAHTPEGAYEYFFLDESFEQLHRADARFGRIFGFFTTLAVFIACLGLFGLAAFTAEQRTKEIGIRKVLGASVAGIVLLLSTDFLKLVAAAFVLATPLAYLVMQRWLDGFAYRTDLGPGVFVLAGALVLGIALATVSYQAVRAAFANPVESLRYE